MESCELEQTAGQGVKGRKGKALLWAFIISTWTMVILLPLAMGLVSIFIIYGPEEYIISPTDQLPIRTISKTMCKSLTVQSPVQMNMVLMNAPPSENGARLNVTSPQLTFDVRQNGHWSFYLLTDSYVTFMFLKPVSNVRLAVIKGDSNFHDWTETDGSCQTCIAHQYLFINQSTSTATYYANETDSFFFVFVPEKNSKPQTSTYKITLNKNTYHLDSDQKCLNKKTCTFQIFSRTYQEVYVQGSNQERFIPVKVKATCNPHIWMYFFAFFVGPVAIGAVLTSTACYLQKVYEQNIMAALAKEQELNDNTLPYHPFTIAPGASHRRFVPQLDDIEEVASMGSCDSNSPLLTKRGLVHPVQINSDTDTFSSSKVQLYTGE